MSNRQDSILYKKLDSLRTQIKRKQRRETGKASTVCTDDSLEKIVALKPKTLEDLAGVNGIGKEFVAKYGQMFIDIVVETLRDVEHTIALNSSTRYTLKELEKKLVNINKRNKMLYLPKVSRKIAADMSDIPNVLDFLLGKTKKLTLPITQITVDEETGDLIEEQGPYSKVKPIATENDAYMRETGANCLYIGYPFVIGKLPAEDFTVRAPLVLFPVKYETTTRQMVLTMDEEHDIIYNTTLLLANQKVCGQMQALPENFMPEISKSSFLADIYDFYEENDCALQQPTNVALPGVRAGWKIKFSSPKKVDNVFECDSIHCDFQGVTIWLDSKKSSWDTTEILNQYIQNVEQFCPSKTLQWYYHWICQKFYVRQDGQSVSIFFPKKRLGYLSPPYEQLPDKIKEYIDTRAYE